MKALEAVLDIVLLVVILVSMLAFIPSASHELRKSEAWGFGQTDDKSMSYLSGDPDAKGYVTDAYSAAEIILTTRVANYPTMNENNYVLPDGSVIQINLEYRNFMEGYTAMAQSVLTPEYRYGFVYDYNSQIWKVERK